MELAGDIYDLALEYCRTRWQDVNVINDFSLDEGIPLVASKSACAIGYVRKDGIRYGCLNNKRTKVDSLAFICDNQQRTPVEITALLLLQIGDKAPHLCALICHMTADDNLPQFPWDL